MEKDMAEEDDKHNKQVIKRGKLCRLKKPTNSDTKDSIHPSNLKNVIAGNVSLNQSDDFRDKMTAFQPLPQPSKKQRKTVRRRAGKIVSSVEDTEIVNSTNASSNASSSLKKTAGEERCDKMSNCEESVESRPSDVVSLDCEVPSDNKQHAADHKQPDLKQCQSCKEMVRSVDWVSHTVNCLRQHFQHKKKTKETSTVDDSNLAVRLQQREEEKKMEEQLTETGYEFCRLCQKDLTHLNSTRRMQHANRCLDKEEEDSKAQEELIKALEKAKNKVLDCPVCGQPLKSQNARKTHLKKCASNLKIPLKTMMNRVKQQEEEYQLQLTAGVLPPDNRPAKKNNIEKPSTSRKRGKAAQPKTQLDEDTQLALALSTSITAQQRQSIAMETVETAIEKEIKSAYAVLMTPKQDKQTKTTKKKKVPTATLR